MRTRGYEVRAGAITAAAIIASILGCSSMTMSSNNGTSLVEVVKNHDATVLRTALKGGQVRANEQLPDGTTALQWAAYVDDADAVKQLLAARADPNLANAEGATPLWLVAESGDITIASALLEAGAKPDAALPSGETVLMRAAWGGNLEVVRLLLAHHADVNKKESEKGQTALMWAIAQKHTDVADALIKAGADVQALSKAGFTPLLFAARFGATDAVPLLVKAGANIDYTVPTPPDWGKPHPINLDYRIKVTSPGASALLVATVRGQVDTALALLENGADPNLMNSGFTPLHWAAGTWESDWSGVEGIKASSEYESEKEWIASAGVPAARKVELVKALLAHGASPNLRIVLEPQRVGFTKYYMEGLAIIGATPLLLAAQADDVEVMNLLVAHGADPSIKLSKMPPGVTRRRVLELGTAPPDNEGATILMAAAGLGRVVTETRVTESEALEAVKLALALGNDINGKTADGETALHGAALAKMNRVVEYLVAHGADINAKNKDGETPLVYAERVLQFAGKPMTQRTSTGDLLRHLAAS
jgi:ankyrin repeat protein